MKKIKKYYWLTKPGIVFGNVLAAIAGFFLASGHAGMLDAGTLFALVVGIALVIASACVFNNYLDRGIDGKMERTRQRATVSGDISVWAVFVFLGILGIVGFTLLVIFTNAPTVALVAVAYFAYVVLYGVAKRRTIHGTLVGTIPGGIPPVAGYVAVTDSFDLAALLIFSVMLCWQMAHFYAIGMRRRDEYAAAGLPVMPVVKGMHTTKVQILSYVAGFIVMNILLTVMGYTGYIYAVIMTVLGGMWFIKGVRGFQSHDDQEWAKRMFLFSLTVLLLFCVMLSVGGLLP